MIIQDQEVTGEFNTKIIHIPAKRSFYILRPAKDDLGLKVSGISNVLCGYGKAYTGETCRPIETRCKEYE
jgi:hypothetical protein